MARASSEEADFRGRKKEDKRTQKKQIQSNNVHNNWPWIAQVLYGNSFFRFHIVPLFLTFGIFFGTQILVMIGCGEQVSVEKLIENYLGNRYSLLTVLAFYFWALYKMMTAESTIPGPETHFGFKPDYAMNGFEVFIKCMIAVVALNLLFVQPASLIYENLPQLMGNTSVLGLIFSFYLYFKGKYNREHKNDLPEPAPPIYEFYRGMELHPRIFGVDVKQWTNCRVGMMSWPVLASVFTILYCRQYGYCSYVIMHYILQMTYITKFFIWENGYFHTLDMMMDRAGFYLCWGCLAFLPAYFSFPNAYTLTYPYREDADSYLPYFWGILGVSLSFVQYLADQQKASFRANWPSLPIIGGKPATFIMAEYTDIDGHKKKSPLLTSGFWGIARHFNYFLELIISFSMSATLGFNLWTFSYFFLIAPLVLHRILRDEAKCAKKYGEHWTLYKKQVPYVLMPGVI